MTYDIGDIVLIGFPFTNLATTKKRPAVILSCAEYQTSRPDVVLMAITSQIRQPLGFGEALLADWQQAGLLKPSVFKPLIATIERTRVIKKMGSLTARDLLTLRTLLCSTLGLEDIKPD